MNSINSNIIQIPVRDDLKHISETTIFSYREVWVMSQFVHDEALKLFLDSAVLLGVGIGEYLDFMGIAPAAVVNHLLYGEAVYVNQQNTRQ